MNRKCGYVKHAIALSNKANCLLKPKQTTEDIPAELSDLNVLEKRLISLRISFMKMVALPRGKQQAIHGPAVNVPTSLAPVRTLLPRLPSQVQVQLVALKLKRKLSYRGHYMYDHVRPAKFLVALQWLIANNPLYHDVPSTDNWQHAAVQDDGDLLQAYLDQESIRSPKDSSLTERLFCGCSGVARH